MPTATSAFTIESWDQSPLDDAPGAQLACAVVHKTFTGDLQATSTTNILLAGVLDGSGPRAYCGVERITGSLDGLAGSFVLLHNALDSGDDHGTAGWTILPGSGTAALSGITGSAEITNDDGAHRLTVGYEL